MDSDKRDDDSRRGHLFGLLLEDFGRMLLKFRKFQQSSGGNRFGEGERKSLRQPFYSISGGRKMSEEQKVLNVLFLCTHNSARSIMGEAILNNLAVSRGRFKAYSAGSHPGGQPNPLALECISRARLSTAGLRSKDWDEFAGPNAPKLDFVITVCDNAANEVCPIWPGQPMTAHWGLPDPAAVEGTDEIKRRAFSSTFVALSNRINIFVNLPMDKLDRLSLQKKMDDIGKAQ